MTELQESLPFITNRYRVRRRLGSGSTGTALLADDILSGLPVTIKVLESGELDPHCYARIRREFTSGCDLRHPLIAELLDFGFTEKEHRPFYSREFVPGQPLAPGPPSPEVDGDPRVFLRPILDLLEALEYLHAHGISHGDVHAGNLIVPEDPRRGAVLIDRGFPSTLHVAAAADPLPPPGSPGEAADIVAAGRLLLFRLAGPSVPGGGRAIVVPGWSERLLLQLERILEKAIQADPCGQFASIAEFRCALADALGIDRATSGVADPVPPVVGREEEIEAARRAVRRVEQRRVAILAFHGPAGTGKSRLLIEVRRLAQMHGLKVVHVSFGSDSESTSPLGEALRSELGEGQETSSWLAALRSDPEASTRDRCRLAAESFFARAGPSLVLLVDGLEFADRQSESLTRAMLQSAAARLRQEEASRGLLVGISTRSSPRSFVPPAARDGVHRLPPLSRSEAAGLLRALLKPLDVHDSVISRLCEETARIPLRLRQSACALRETYGSTGHVPEDAPIPGPKRRGASLVADFLQAKPALRETLEVLAAFDHPTTAAELVAATELPRRAVEAALAKLFEIELVHRHRRSGRRVYLVADPETAKVFRSGLTRKALRSARRRAADCLRSKRGLDLDSRESLCRHMLALNQRPEGTELALRVSSGLLARGRPTRALNLLELAFASERSRGRKLEIAERVSEIHASNGDHPDGIAALERVLPLLKHDATAVRVHRRLGAHFHRAGRRDECIRHFRRALRINEGCGKDDEAILIYSELAELYTGLGQYSEAEQQCRRGLETLNDASPRRSFRGEMEVTLRATLGHLELRRHRPQRARVELEAALQLAQSRGTRELLPLILNNLGIVYNQLDEFVTARECLHRAANLLSGAGDREVRIHLACNLATIEAKIGNAGAASRQIARAHGLSQGHPGERLRFAVSFCDAVTHHYLGRLDRAIPGFRQCIPIGRRLGDGYLVHFARVYLAEGLILCGRHGEAHEILRESLSAEADLPDSLKRMVGSRARLVAALLGSRGLAARATALLDRTPPSSQRLLEAWNDVFAALASALESKAEPGQGPGGPAVATVLRDCLAVFEELRVPAGSRLCRAALLVHCAAQGRSSDIRERMLHMEGGEGVEHPFLSVLEPLAKAEALYFLAELDACETELRRASSAMVGNPFLELDWCLEFLRARLADRRGETQTARHHLHRSLQSRDLLCGAVPKRFRDRFAKHERFSELRQLAGRLKRPPFTPRTPRLGGGPPAHGLVGSSPSLQQVVTAMDRLRDVDLSVLICGESGTGKEVVARALHRSGARSQGPFQCLPCASLPGELLESELFGVEAGAFTGAEESRPGLLRHLDGGTLVFDEVSHLPRGTQAKLLQVLDSRTFRPLGGLQLCSSSVRFVFTSSVDPEEAIRRGELRQDLYHRLRQAQISIPPLRDRPEDISPLVAHFMELHSRRLGRQPLKLEASCLRCLRDHAWPGNVRELETVVIRLLVQRSPGMPPSPAEIRALFSSPAAEDGPLEKLFAGRSLREVQATVEREYLRRLFRQTAGDIPRMARELGVRRNQVYARFRALGLDVKRLRAE